MLFFFFYNMNTEKDRQGRPISGVIANWISKLQDKQLLDSFPLNLLVRENQESLSVWF